MKDASEERKIKISLLNFGFEILMRCPCVKKTGPGTILDITNEPPNLGEDKETMQLNLGMRALSLR